MSATQDKRIHKYPSAFRYGFAMGIFIQLSSRIGTREPLAARPFSYLTLGMGVGLFMTWYDHWKRISLEEVLYAQDAHQYHCMVAGMNNVRIGEEEETLNMVEYLSGTTTKL